MKSLFELYTGLAIVFLAYKTQPYRGPGHRHMILGTGFILCSLFCSMASASRLISSGPGGSIFGVIESLVLNFAAPLIFFEGLAFFLRQAPNAKKVNQHGPLGRILVRGGVGIGLANAGLMVLTSWWPATLLAGYEWLGFHGVVLFHQV